MGPTPIRLLLVDDHPILLDGLTALVQSQSDMTVLAVADSADTAFSAVRDLCPDVTVLDLRLPGASGADLVRGICRLQANTKVVVLTNSLGGDEIVRALEAGALAYLFKTSARTDLLAAIRAAHAGRRFLPPDVAARVAGQFPLNPLSQRELRVLELMAEGLRNKEIGGSLEIAESTVKEHVRNILTKLHVTDRTAAVTAALRQGILQLPN